MPEGLTPRRLRRIPGRIPAGAAPNSGQRGSGFVLCSHSPKRDPQPADQPESAARCAPDDKGQSLTLPPRVTLPLGGAVVPDAAGDGVLKGASLCHNRRIRALALGAQKAQVLSMQSHHEWFLLRASRPARNLPTELGKSCGGHRTTRRRPGCGDFPKTAFPVMRLQNPCSHHVPAQA
jgi:hypothetical protein